MIDYTAAVNAGVMTFWVATYQNGEHFSQFNGGVEHSTQELDYTRLKSLAVHHVNGRKLIAVEFEHGQYPIYRRRVRVRHGCGDREIVHVIGWRTKDPDMHKVWFVHESTLEIHEGFDGDGIHCQIQYLPHDEISVCCLENTNG